MADFIGWLTDTFNLEFTVGTVTVTLGYLAIGTLIVNRGLRALRGIK